ncbi:hypothetical protein F5Y16DRAFT_249551 [Xylariaceae sp. FL0255]|nr:hypothetical protein F5Y16DRAFT_249551 [Xylariaceae sp. FL0255]
MATTIPANHVDQYASSTATAATTSSTNDQANSEIGKDEVAWFFVEQYYTTLSKTPEKLHLFYGKRSQFVYGQEGQSANVDVGRQTIQERIKNLDFQNCKVRVSNVDSQASHENILIQVIGETSNKAGDPKKFVQTFVLAQQPSGYFVLNDILRYIDDESDDEPTSTVQMPSAEEPDTNVAESVEAPEPVHINSVEEKAEVLDAGIVDKKLEEVATQDEPASVDEVASEAAPEAEAEAAPEVANKAEEEAVPDPETTARELAEEAAKEPEKPADPSPTPVITRTNKPAAPAPAAPQPTKPMTWASRIAAAAGPAKVTPAVPITKTSGPAATRTAPTPAANSAATQPAAAASQATEEAAPTKEAPTEWQTAGTDSKRQNRPQSISGPPAEKEGTLGYVKYVTDKVGKNELESALAKYGELAYFDINRQKNCAFVEFKTVAGYNAAVAANPHVVNGESIMVEPRRPKAGAYGGANYGASRGGMQNRGGRGGFDGNRSGSQGGRGGFGGQNRGRGGNMQQRGRGGAQVATN